MAETAASRAAGQRRNATLVRRLRSERGIALPVGLLLLLSIAMIAAAAATASVTASSQSRHDRGVKRSLAAADAGLSTAVYRLNKLEPSELLCVVVGATGLELEPVQADGWCRAQTENLGDGATYSYRVSGAAPVTLNGQALLQRRIVSTGTVGGVKRRILSVVGTLTGKPLFGGNAVTSIDNLLMPNSSSVAGSVGTNGNVSLSGSAQLCGDAVYGAGKQFSAAGSSSQCPGFVHSPADQAFVLTPVDQEDSAIVNDNSRIGGLDPLITSSGTVWDPAKRVLRLKQTASLELTGDVYSFCALELDNSAQLIIAPRDATRPPLKIYIDAPENCPGVTGAGSVKLSEQAGIVNHNDNSSTLQIYVVGSPQATTTVEFKNNFQASVAMLIYAPRSTVTLQNSTIIVGAVAAQRVTLQNSARVVWSPSAAIVIDNLILLFQQQSWMECPVKATGTTPDSGC